MRALHTALLTGPYDWDPSLLPQAEFESRLAAVRRVMEECGATALLVHGITTEHGGLAYVTGFTPKLGPAFALIPATGALRLLPSGSGTMLSSARRLTWVEDLQPYSDITKPLGAFLTEIASGGELRLGLWGEEAMTQRGYEAIVATVAPHGMLLPMDERLDALRRRKSPVEFAMLRRAATVCRLAADEFTRKMAERSGARTASLAAEATAYAAGAQDVRILASARDGGPPIPFDTSEDRRVDSLLAEIAIRFAGYWAEALITVTARPGEALTEARAGLAAMVRAARPAATAADLARAAASELRSCTSHAPTQSTFGNGIGLSLEEAPVLAVGSAVRLEEGGVYVLRNGAVSESGETAAVSAMVAIGADGAEILDV
jgi:Xaa-Pro aminopeptidase